MITFLSKSGASAGFDQIVDFINAQIIQKKVVVIEDVIRQYLCLDDADGVECLPNEEIFAELARMGYEKPPPKLTFYKAFFTTQCKFLIHTLVQFVSAKRTTWNEFSCSMTSAVICLATVAQLEQGKISQALEILNLKKRIKKLEKKQRSKSSGLKRLRNVDDVSAAATKDVNAAETTVFDDEEVAMTMAQALIKMKAEKARFPNE
nr:hypothetical protein [Tanacetum cinerariifolium]